jgi:FtsZ-binding cell division protein ZapB
LLAETEQTMYPDLNQIEQSDDKPPSGLVGIGFAVPSDSADDAKRRLLESGIESVRALKGFIVEYDRMKEERDQLKRQITGSLEEVETLRKQVQQLEVQRDQFSNTLSALISQIETVVRKAQHFIDTAWSRLSRSAASAVAALSLLWPSFQHAHPLPDCEPDADSDTRRRPLGKLIKFFLRRMPHAGLLGDRPMTGPGAWRSIHCVGTVALFVLPYGSSAAGCIPGTEAIKLTVPLEPEAQSA